MAGFYERWIIKQSDVTFELNRSSTPEENEIIWAAERRGYTKIKIDDNDEVIEGIDKDGRHCIIAEK